MSNIFRISFLVAALFVLSVSLPAMASEEETLAVKAADAWLELIDKGEYDKSWDESAGYFRKAITKSQWTQQLTAYRKPLGKLIYRKVKSTKYVTSLPGAPDGEYVLIKYEASYENKETAMEMVTPMKEAGGEWRVSGYYLQ